MHRWQHRMKPKGGKSQWERFEFNLTAAAAAQLQPPKHRPGHQEQVARSPRLATPENVQRLGTMSPGHKG